MRATIAPGLARDQAPPNWKRHQCHKGDHKVMGAGVAASPHCPFAGDTRPGRRGSPRWAVSRFEPEPGARAPILRSPSGACAPSGFPAGSPSGPKPWRFAAWQFRNRGPGSCHPADASAEALVPRSGRIALAEASGPAWQSMDLHPGSCRFRSSRAETRSCPTGSGPKPFSAGGSAPTASRFLPGRNPGPKSVVPSVLVRYPKVPEPGRLTMPAAFASAKGQARSIRLAAASSAARAFAPLASLSGGTRGPSSLGLWLGRLSTVAGQIVSATSESCHEN